jgi:hypothetical protein
MTMKHEYHEGPKAAQDFGRTVIALFRAPKTINVSKPAPAKKAAKWKCASRVSAGA